MPRALGTTTKSVKIGYEISFTRYFYEPEPMRTLAEIRTDILALERDTAWECLSKYCQLPGMNDGQYLESTQGLSRTGGKGRRSNEDSGVLENNLAVIGYHPVPSLEGATDYEEVKTYRKRIVSGMRNLCRR